MEFELGLKIRKNLDDTCTDFRIAKDRGGTIFVSNETESMFILTSHLRGYIMENINIDINEDATLITISGGKQIQEMVMKGLTMHKKEMEVKRFMKVFQIPCGVILDRVNAKFNEIDSTLTIYMPKLNNGIIGDVIQEVEDEKIVESILEKQSNSDGVQEVSEMHSKSRRHYEILENSTTFPSENRKRDGKQASTSRETQGECSNTENGDKIEEMKGTEEVSYDVRTLIEKDDCESVEKSERNEVIRNTSDEQNELERHDRKCSTSMFFAPCFFIGGAFFASLVVLVCNFVRLKRR